MGAEEFFGSIAERADPERLAGVESTYLFDVTGAGRWLVAVHDGKVTVTENPDRGADVVFTLSSETFDRLLARKQSPMIAYMTGKLKISGDIGVAMELQKLFPS
jgi:putative sterol carrier protein